MHAFVPTDKSRIVRTNPKVLMSDPHKYVASEKQSKTLTRHPSRPGIYFARYTNETILISIAPGLMNRDIKCVAGFREFRYPIGAFLNNWLLDDDIRAMFGIRFVRHCFDKGPTCGKLWGPRTGKRRARGRGGRL